MSPDQTDLITKYFQQLTAVQIDQLKQLRPLYTHWNKKVNVISRQDIDALYTHHVLHSLGIAKVCQFYKDTKVLDVGTGGGFPGLPLAILFPDSRFHLIDSIGKKIKVVNEIVRELDLSNVTAAQTRAEEVSGQYDFVVSRAVVRIRPFYSWVKDRIRPGNSSTLSNGILYLKGGDLEEEMQELGKHYKLFGLKDFFREDFFTTKKVVYLKIVKQNL